MNKKYIVEIIDINPDYQEDVEGNLEELLTSVVDFANDINIEDITEDEE